MPGFSGVTGSSGSSGVPGSTGSDGSSGVHGVPGSTGSDGSSGVHGVSVLSYTYVISCFTPGLYLPFVVFPFSSNVGFSTGFSVLTNLKPSFSFLPVVYESSSFPFCKSPGTSFLDISFPSLSFDI